MAKRKEEPVSATYTINFGEYKIHQTPLEHLDKQMHKFENPKFKIVLKEEDGFEAILECISETLQNVEYVDENGEALEMKERDKKTNDVIAALGISGIKNKQQLDDYLGHHNMIFEDYKSFEKTFKKIPVSKIHHLAILTKYEDFPVTLKFKLKKNSVEESCIYTVADSKNEKFPVNSFFNLYTMY